MKFLACFAFFLILNSASFTQTKLLVNYKDGGKDTIALNGLSDVEFVPSVAPMIEEVADVFFSRYDDLSAIAVGPDSNLYVSGMIGQIGQGIYKVLPNGGYMQYAQHGTEADWSSLKFGPGDTLIAARRVPALFYVDPKTVATPKLYTRLPLSTAITDFDFDTQKNIWCGNPSDSAIYRINRLNQVRTFPSIGHVKSIRVFDNALYIASEVPIAGDTTEKVYKFPFIAADTSLGTPEEYFNLRAVPGYEHKKISAITFDASGRLYIGTDGAAGILVVSGPMAKPAPLYNGLIGANVVGFQWGPSTHLYVIRKTATSQGPEFDLLKVDMQTEGAPYYGR